MRARRLLSRTHLKHTLGVAGNIANKRIDLRHADIHHGILSHTGQAKTGDEGYRISRQSGGVVKPRLTVARKGEALAAEHQTDTPNPAPDEADPIDW